MSTPVQILANRTNSILSTGPRSEAGKSTVSRNAVSHGLSSGSAVLACEDRAAFDASLTNLIAEFAPRTGHEDFLIQQMAEARWRLARIRRIEAAAFNSLLGSADPQSADTRLAEALLNQGGDLLSKLQRYAAAAERSYYKAHKELTGSTESPKPERAPAPTLDHVAVLDGLLQPVYKTKPIDTAFPTLEALEEDELELLTRPLLPKAA